MCYWSNLGRSDGITLVDIMGRCPLTLNGSSTDSNTAIGRVLTYALMVGKQSTVTAAVGQLPYRRSSRHMLIR
jgi:hypothetical protein